MKIMQVAKIVIKDFIVAGITKASESAQVKKSYSGNSIKRLYEQY